MTLPARVTLTKTFVRDISLLAEHADGLVLTASSNVGRLLLLLAGEDKVLEGRVRSLDTRSVLPRRWRPSSALTFTPLADGSRRANFIRRCR
jgi:hypothetical protein